MPLVLTISLLVPISLLVKSAVHEKERLLAFSMRMAGLPVRTHLLGWMRHALFEFGLVAVLITACTTVFMPHTSVLVILLVALAIRGGLRGREVQGAKPIRLIASQPNAGVAG